MKKVLLVLFLISSVSTSIFAQALYSNTSYSSRFNPGIGSKGAPIVAYDDINIPTTIGLGTDSISITKINIGIRRAPNAPATNVNLYYTTFRQDSTGENTLSNSAVFLGKISLPVNGASLNTSIITLGDSLTALFKIGTNVNNTPYKLLIGASFDNPSPGNGIILSKSSNDEGDSLWIDPTNGSKELYATSFSSNIPASYYMQVFGKANGNPIADDKRIPTDVASSTKSNPGITK